MAELYIGLMSGTSLDGVDAVLVDFDTAQPKVLCHCSTPFPASLKVELLALNTPGHDELHRAALAANALVEVYAEQVRCLLEQAHIVPARVHAIGAHGQTVRHRPLEFDGVGYTLQLNQPALLAERCGIDVVADFRSRDVAAGGQGAPLVPPFHQAFFGRCGETVAVLNIGGISNISVVPANGSNVIGYDCGPGNTLLDSWCQKHTGQPFDASGQWAAHGSVNTALLASLMAEAYFSKPPPKSTGRDLFNWQWLEHRLDVHPGIAAMDVQATLTELTAQTCANSLKAACPSCQTLIVCGGGALNLELMRRLRSHLLMCSVESSERHGLPPTQVEATAFAWLARQACHRKTASLVSVTGARGARVLGAIYPA